MITFVIRDHGPIIEDQVHDQTHSLNGGCRRGEPNSRENLGLEILRYILENDPTPARLITATVRTKVLLSMKSKSDGPTGPGVGDTST